MGYAIVGTIAWIIFVVFVWKFVDGAKKARKD